jgi:hypothetical protein
MFIAFEDHNLIIKLKHAVRPLKSTRSLFNHNIRGIPTELVLIKIAHQGVLFRKPIRLKPRGIAEFALVVRIQDHEKATRNTGSFYEVLILLLAMRLAVRRNEVLTVECGLPTDRAFCTRTENHSRQTMSCAA